MVLTALAVGLLAAGVAVAAEPDAYAGTNAAARGVADPTRAWRNYALNCQGCHRSDGAGDPDSAPALAGHIAVFTRMEGGRAYLGRVPGVATSPLADDELAELLNWVLWRFDPEHMSAGFPPYGADEIGRLRRSPLRTEAATTRAALLARSDARP